jgi:hypothetical protein
MECLVNRFFGVKGETRINFGRNFARHDLEDLAAKGDEKSVEGGIDFVVQIFALDTSQYGCSRMT